MSINAMQKILCLSIFLFCNPLSAMDLRKRLEGYTSKIVLSDAKQVVAFAVGVPLMAAGSILLFNNADKISSSFENFSMPEGNTLLGVGTVAAIPVMYSIAQRNLTTEAHFKQYKSWLDKNKEENLIVKYKEEIRAILNIDNEKEQEKELKNFITRKFAVEASKKHPFITMVEKIDELESEVIREKEILGKISDKSKVSQANFGATNLLKQLKKDIRSFRALIIQHPEYRKHINTYSNAKNADLKEQKFVFGTKWGSVMSALSQPISQVCLILLGALLAKFGIQ